MHPKARRRVRSVPSGDPVRPSRQAVPSGDPVRPSRQAVPSGDPVRPSHQAVPSGGPTPMRRVRWVGSARRAQSCNPRTRTMKDLHESHAMADRLRARGLRVPKGQPTVRHLQVALEGTPTPGGSRANPGFSPAIPAIAWPGCMLLMIWKAASRWHDAPHLTPTARRPDPADPARPPQSNTARRGPASATLRGPCPPTPLRPRVPASQPRTATRNPVWPAGPNRHPLSPPDCPRMIP